MSSRSQEPPILLLIDIQHGLVEGPSSWGPRSTPQFTKNVTEILQIWRSKSWPVLHVYHDDILEPDNPISTKSPMTFAPHISATPKEGELQFIKHVGSPFVATELPAVIKTYGHRKIVVIGMDGSECILGPKYFARCPLVNLCHASPSAAGGGGGGLVLQLRG